MKTRWLKLKASTWAPTVKCGHTDSSHCHFLCFPPSPIGSQEQRDVRSFSKRLWFVTIVQYINQSWIYCEKWNLLATTSTSTPTSTATATSTPTPTTTWLGEGEEASSLGSVSVSVSVSGWLLGRGRVSGAACGSHKFHALRRRCYKSMFCFFCYFLCLLFVCFWFFC